MPKYSDDENPNHEAGESTIGPEVEVIHGEKIDVRINHKKEVPRMKTELDVSVELTGSAQPRDNNRRLGVDIVVMLDLSSSMSRNERRRYLQTSMEFLISKLCPIDRMSVVKLSSTSAAERLCPLRLMTEDAKGDIENMVKSVQVSTEGSPANLAAGLKEALKVLNDRAYFQGRKPAIMVLSSSEATYDAARVPLRDVPVHAFAIGCDYTHHVLKEIARGSNGGTFAVLDSKETESISDLSPVFFECLAKLLTVVVQDLKISLTPLKENYASGTEVVVEGEIELITKKGDAKYHHQAESDETGSITVSLGNLYRQETCKVLVKLTLPAVKEELMNTRVLQLTYSYRDGMESCNGGPIAVTVSRMGLASLRKRNGTRDAGDSPHSAKRSRRGTGNVFRAPMPSNCKLELVSKRPVEPMVKSSRLSAQQRANIVKGVQSYDADKNDIVSVNDDKSKTVDNKDSKKR